MSFPDLPEGYDRHKDALAIVDPGAPQTRQEWRSPSTRHARRSSTRAAISGKTPPSAS